MQTRHASATPVRSGDDNAHRIVTSWALLLFYREGQSWVYGIAWTAVMILVFEEADGINRIHALVICLVINVFSHELLGRIF